MGYCGHFPILDEDGYWICDYCGVPLSVVELSEEEDNERRKEEEE